MSSAATAVVTTPRPRTCGPVRARAVSAHVRLSDPTGGGVPMRLVGMCGLVASRSGEALRGNDFTRVGLDHPGPETAEPVKCRPTIRSIGQ